MEEGRKLTHHPGDCTSLSPTSLRWTKISHAGLTTNTWATDTLIKNGFTASTTIPAKLAPGNYVIRHEIIALHGAQYVNGAQLYMQCINLRVGGSGYVKPTSGWPGWSLYRKDEPGVVFNLYNGYTSYPVPGMAVWTGAN
jgi:cellulase